MTSKVTFSFEVEGNPDELVKGSDEMQRLLGDAAEELRDTVSSLAPGDDFPDTITVSEVNDVGFIVYTEDFKAWWIEFGTGQRHTRDGANRGEMPAFAPFRRGIEAIGAR